MKSICHLFIYFYTILFCNMSYLHALLPADPQVSSGQETGDGVPGQVVDPAFLPQLGHDGVDPGEAGPALRPLGQGLGVAVPGDLDADGVALHLVEAGVVGGCRVEELAPEQLTVERERRGAVLLHLGGWRESGSVIIIYTSAINCAKGYLSFLRKMYLY